MIETIAVVDIWLKMSGRMIVESGTISWIRVSAKVSAAMARKLSEVPMKSFATTLWSALVAAVVQPSRHAGISRVTTSGRRSAIVGGGVTRPPPLAAVCFRIRGIGLGRPRPRGRPPDPLAGWC